MIRFARMGKKTTFYIELLDEWGIFRSLVKKKLMALNLKWCKKPKPRISNNKGGVGSSTPKRKSSSWLESIRIEDNGR